MGSVRSVPRGAGPPDTNLIDDAQVISKWGQMSIDANPDMMKARRRFCFPTAVDFDPGTDRVIVGHSQRNRLQIYGQVRDYVDVRANLQKRFASSRSRDDAETKDGA
jgi:hypothetical protein